ncbi:hypothetical protein D4Q85_01055 [bacterium]|nr:MAG: hypothetical protein D4Q85_01055 [bacterium]
MKVLAVASDTADAYYRANAPFGVLNYRTRDEYRVVASAKGAPVHDVLFLRQCTDVDSLALADRYLSKGKPVVYDVDDLLTEIPPSWPCYGQYRDSGTDGMLPALRAHKMLLETATLVTCASSRLARRLRAMTPAPVVHLPNCVMMAEWDMIAPKAVRLDGPVLGWFGTGNHWDDWGEIVGAVDEALEEVGGYLALLGAPELVRFFPERLQKRTKTSNLVPMKQCGEIRQMIKVFTVGLAWCTDRLEANRCRSPLKAIQYGAAGVPVVASQAVYGEQLEGWDAAGGVGPLFHEYGYTVNSTASLVPVLEMALTVDVGNAKPRRWQEQVWQHHSYEQQATRWAAVFEKARELV